MSADLLTTCARCGASHDASTGEPFAPYLFQSGRAWVVCAYCEYAIEVACMRESGSVFGYLTPDANGRPDAEIRTFLGAHLLKVLSVSAPRRVGFGRRIYVRALDLGTGREWYGSGPADNGTFVRMKVVKGGRR